MRLFPLKNKKEKYNKTRILIKFYNYVTRVTSNLPKYRIIDNKLENRGQYRTFFENIGFI